MKRLSVDKILLTCAGLLFALLVSLPVHSQWGYPATYYAPSMPTAVNRFIPYSIPQPQSWTFSKRRARQNPRYTGWARYEVQATNRFKTVKPAIRRDSQSVAVYKAPSIHGYKFRELTPSERPVKTSVAATKYQPLAAYAAPSARIQSRADNKYYQPSLRVAFDDGTHVAQMKVYKFRPLDSDSGARVWVNQQRWGQPIWQALPVENAQWASRANRQSFDSFDRPNIQWQYRQQLNNY